MMCPPQGDIAYEREDPPPVSSLLVVAIPNFEVVNIGHIVCTPSYAAYQPAVWLTEHG